MREREREGEATKWHTCVCQIVWSPAVSSDWLGGVPPCHRTGWAMFHRVYDCGSTPRIYKFKTDFDFSRIMRRGTAAPGSARKNMHTPSLLKKIEPMCDTKRNNTRNNGQHPVHARHPREGMRRAADRRDRTEDVRRRGAVGARFVQFVRLRSTRPVTRAPARTWSRLSAHARPTGRAKKCASV